jgi:hypothetical protein
LFIFIFSFFSFSSTSVFVERPPQAVQRETRVICTTRRLSATRAPTMAAPAVDPTAAESVVVRNAVVSRRVFAFAALLRLDVLQLEAAWRLPAAHRTASPFGLKGLNALPNRQLGATALQGFLTVRDLLSQGPYHGAQCRQLPDDGAVGRYLLLLGGQLLLQGILALILNPRLFHEEVRVACTVGEFPHHQVPAGGQLTKSLFVGLIRGGFVRFFGFRGHSSLLETLGPVKLTGHVARDHGVVIYYK